MFRKEDLLISQKGLFSLFADNDSRIEITIFLKIILLQDIQKQWIFKLKHGISPKYKGLLIDMTISFYGLKMKMSKWSGIFNYDACRENFIKVFILCLGCKLVEDSSEIINVKIKCLNSPPGKSSRLPDKFNHFTVEILRCNRKF